MARNDFTIKRGDTSPALSVKLFENNELADIDDGSFAFRMYHVSKDIIVSGTCSTNSETNEVVYFWQDGDTDVTGDYNAEFVVDYNSDIPESYEEFDVDKTFPSDGFLKIKISKTLE